MLKFLAVIVVIWLALMPPLFTDGTCTAEFDRESAKLSANQKSLATPVLALAYWANRQLPVSTLTAKQCRLARSKFVDSCSSGELLYVTVPIENRICRIYRDDEIRIKLQYDDKGRLTRMQTDMNPFKSLPLPWFGVTVHWGR